jgi:cytochrome P450
MSFLAPNALTICHDDQWKRLRVFNEKVLCAGEPHVYRQEFLGIIHKAFSSPVSNIEDIRRRMGQAMLGIVFGDGVAPERLAEDIQVLFGLVQSPIKRLVFGSREERRREKFYDTVRKIWRESKETQLPNLLSLAHKAAAESDEAELIQQVPHWMFTFTGSGTEVLARTLALVTSRPLIRARVLSEITQSGALDDPSNIERLHYLEACLLESARLFSPVPRTFHCAPRGDAFGDVSIAPGMEIAHYFPLNQRDHKSDPSADNFQPERWLDPASPAHTIYPNLFLSGARACPGKNLILFVCKSAIAILLKEHDLRAESAVLSADPLPFSLPQEEIHFHI